MMNEVIREVDFITEIQKFPEVINYKGMLARRCYDITSEHYRLYYIILRGECILEMLCPIRTSPRVFKSQFDELRKEIDNVIKHN